MTLSHYCRQYLGHALAEQLDLLPGHSIMDVNTPKGRASQELIRMYGDLTTKVPSNPDVINPLMASLKAAIEDIYFGVTVA